MAAASSTTTRFCLLLALVLPMISSAAAGDDALPLPMTPSYYRKSCPTLEAIVRGTMLSAIKAERRMGASILRLFFHDCFVQGCDASILLDDVPSKGFVGEKTAGPNTNSIRGYEVIDKIKANVEAACPGVVSCADILALAAREGVNLLGGPSWEVPLGRRDSTTASKSEADSDLPGPSSSLADLVAAFGKKGLAPRDMTALSGAHTIGYAQCQFFRGHIYNDTNVDPLFAAERRRRCPAASGSGDSNLAPLDDMTALAFDNAYYRDLVGRRGLLHSDQELFNGGSQDERVKKYSTDPDLFAGDFVAAMIKMGKICPLTGAAGQIRKNCRVVNSS
ncbi:peroxidase P7 [Oryza sativa Japonica Group]|uniref:Peroxidase n=2 Tax=Oryza sativa subsp. japonica TaxID=39947 RepID=Q5U1R5_ORYSJ|nr:peroxidase P7 [Oryza sativa Japonica Group]BAD28874.1 putative bacterial-induced peroxidase precursor [Oryza sativa Japonica Group]BAF08316.1 Os02g0240500 [Oryza sativa Japonica Group]CAH69270.1 TPA: class III peroxidase 28 precursor [Oryza sativa Japonica Group]|eukprot:NP_001046402.1 Os02g0240500 [Oryza sativa Japonica Group]